MTMTQIHPQDRHEAEALCCGHCGTALPQGYTVCASCGASYRRRGSGIFFGIILGIATANAVAAAEWGTALILAIILVFLVRRQRQRLWYRRKA